MPTSSVRSRRSPTNRSSSRRRRPTRRTTSISATRRWPRSATATTRPRAASGGWSRCPRVSSGSSTSCRPWRCSSATSDASCGETSPTDPDFPPIARWSGAGFGICHERGVDASRPRPAARQRRRTAQLLRVEAPGSSPGGFFVCAVARAAVRVRGLAARRWPSRRPAGAGRSAGSRRRGSTRRRSAHPGGRSRRTALRPVSAGPRTVTVWRGVGPSVETDHGHRLPPAEPQRRGRSRRA